MNKKAFEELKNKLGDQNWRLNNLYMIRDAHGNAIPFCMNWAQQNLFDKMHYFNVILKARQLGFSTFILLYLLDSCLFNSNHSAGVIADTRDNAEELFKNKVKFAYDNLAQPIKDLIVATSDSARKLEFSNGSSILVGTSLRGGTFQKLHISEYGKIAARYPDKALEIKTGALNTVHYGQQIFIESTAEGRQGEFFDLCERARHAKEEKKELTPLDPKFHFFSWLDNPSYSLPDRDCGMVSIDEKTSQYFQKLKEQGISLTPGQKSWYVKKAEMMGDMVKREYPSTPDEAFEASLEGAYYAKQMEIIRKNGQIGYFPHEPARPVHTFWDLGQGDDAMAIWFFQEIGNQRRFIRYHESSGEGWEYYANLLKSYGYGYGTHHWPHDGNKRIVSGVVQTSKQIAQSFGITPIKIIPRTNNVESDILNKCRPALPLCFFNDETCKDGIAHLDGYRKEWDDKHGVWKDRPRHDHTSHCADAFRTYAVGYEGKNDITGVIQPYWLNSSQPHFAETEYNMFD